MAYIKKDNPDMIQALTVGLYNYLRRQDFKKHNFSNAAWKIIENALLKRDLKEVTQNDNGCNWNT